MSAQVFRIGLAAILLVGLPACFLPSWGERDWVDQHPPGDDDDDTTGGQDDDDDTGDDDDDTGDDDDDVVDTDIPFSGTADLHLSLYGYPADCQMPIDAELETGSSELDGDGECLLWGYVTAVAEISCDVVGGTVDGIVLIYDNEGYIDTSLNISVDGSYNEGNGTITFSGTGSFYGFFGDITVTLTRS